MADSKTHSGNPDRQRINTSQPYEMRDWANKFGVSEDELREAVAEVGSSAKAVEEHLKRRQTRH